MKILDTTIRDGSYAIDFKFTCGDVKNIVSKSVKLGIEYIEICHGMGLNASSPERGISICTDEEYIKAAKKVSQGAYIGAFCIPGIARLKDLQMAKSQGLDFIRIGVNADQIEKAKDYIIESKKIGLITMVNFMKTYVVTPEEFAKSTEAAATYGADYVYIVDSAGCMVPEQISKYYQAVKEKKLNIKLGFHGHNNLGMAVWNSIHCIKLGFDLIDCSYQGLGRSLGNASTEMLVMAVEKMFGKEMLDIDIPRLLEYGYVLLKDITNKALHNPLDLICGYTGFHSSYLKDIYRCCCEFNVDPLRLIIAYCELNTSELDYNLLCDVAQKLPKDIFEEHPYSFRQFFSNAYEN